MRRQLLSFAGAGIAGLLADVSVLYLALACGSGFYLGRLLSFLVAVWVTWQINRRYAFRASHTAVSKWQEWWRYLAAMSVGGSVNYAVSSMVVLALGHWTSLPVVPLCAVAAGTLAGMGFNFLSAKFFVFRR